MVTIFRFVPAALLAALVLLSSPAPAQAQPERPVDPWRERAQEIVVQFPTWQARAPGSHVVVYEVDARRYTALFDHYAGSYAAEGEGYSYGAFPFMGGEIASIVARNTGRHRYIACRIWLDGRAEQFSVSTAAYGIASCFVIVPD